MKHKIFLLLVAIVASTTLSHAAIVNGACGDNLTWSLNTKDSTLTIEGNGEMTSAEGQSPWFAYSKYVVHVNLPNGLTNIGNSAFKECNNLKSLDIPNSVTRIEGQAFEMSGLTSINIPNSVTSLGGCTFFYCFNLRSIELPNSLISMNGCDFYYCTSLTSVIIGNGLSVIPNQSFEGCTNLQSVTIGSCLTQIDQYAFKDCPITELTIFATTPPSGNGVYTINAADCILYVPASAIDAYANTVWWEDFQQIRAIEGNLFTVDFVDWNGQVIARRFVENGQAAIAPTAPSREGYTFIGWDEDFSNITADLTVTALYEAIPTTNYTLLFTNGIDDSEIASQSVDFTLPAAPVIDGFTFLKWVVVAADLTDTIKIQAVYQANTQTSAPAVYTNPANPAQKLIREGNVYILRGDKTYTLQGQVVQ